MKHDLAKQFDVSQRLEDRTVQFVREINFALGSIAEPKPHRMTGDVTTVNDVR
jgi:hypothetical protein